MKNLLVSIAYFVGYLLGFAVTSFIFGLIVLPLWNWLMPMLFHLPSINYGEAVGLYVLSSLLFGFFNNTFADNDKSNTKYL